MKHQQGFTLIELAIVLVIVTLLVGGLAMPLSAQIQARRIAETRKIMEEAREALIGYAMTHSCICAYTGVGPSGLLITGPATTCTGAGSPCPATNPSSNSTTLGRPYLPCPDANGNTGTESRPANAECLQSRGYFPWRDLGTASQDAWGNRLRYEVTTEFADASIGFSNASINGGNIQICSASGCVPPGDVASNIPVVLVSSGPNGLGAININGNPQAPPTSNDERENANTVTTNSIYVSRIPTQPGVGEFDDLVVWLPTPLLISRVCPSPGGCPP